MPEIQLGAHTIRSHGTQVARLHMHDWLILMLLVVIEVVLNVIEPFHRFVGEDMMEDLKYPLQDNTVPVWAVPVLFCVKHNAESREPFDAFGFTLMTNITFSVVHLQIIAILLPLAVIVIYYFIRKDVFDLHQAMLGKILPC